MTYAETAELFRRHYGRSAQQAATVYRAFYGRGTAVDSDAAALANELHHRPLSLVRQETCDGVAKLVFRLADGLAVETVVIPMANHSTVCVSCQVGCRMGCRICETGQLGLKRHLSVAEIVAQVRQVKVDMGHDVRNVVFMGMGEPLDNFDHVIQAIRVLADQRGLDIALRRITVSTAGLVEGIQRLAALQWPQLKLALSLNAADDALRNELMPINRRYGLSALRRVLNTYPLARGGTLLVEYVLIKEINDRKEHVDQLAAFLKGLPVRLNLIAYNPRRHSPYQAPGLEDVKGFLGALIRKKIFVRLRESKGAAVQAACGQLGASANLQIV